MNAHHCTPFLFEIQHIFLQNRNFLFLSVFHIFFIKKTRFLMKIAISKSMSK